MRKEKEHTGIQWILIMWVVIIFLPFLGKTPVLGWLDSYFAMKFIAWEFFFWQWASPIGFFVTGIWAGKRFGKKKYYFIPLPFVLYMLNMCIVFRSLDLSSYGAVFYLIGAGCSLALAAGLLIGGRSRKGSR